jgi:hypothetical protein
MIKQLVVFGDSWTFGDELLDPALKKETDVADSTNDEYRMSHCWGGIVARDLGLTFVNFGFNGASLQSMIWTATWWAENHNVDESLVLVNLTQPARTSWYLADNKSRVPEWNVHVHATWNSEKIWQNNEDPWRNMYKTHYTYSHCSELSTRNRQQSVIFFDGFANRYNIPVFQFDCYQDQTLFYSQNHIFPGENAQDWASPHYASRNHPTEQGHIQIAKKLTSWIDSVKITK